MKNSMIKKVLLVVLSAIVSAVNINIFVDSSGLFPGGFGGLSFLINRLGLRYELFDIKFGYIYLLFNFFVVLIFYRSCGKTFTILSIVQVVLTSLFTIIFPVFTITNDIFLLSV